MKKANRILAGFLSFVMILGLCAFIPAKTEAAGDITVTYESGEDSDGVLHPQFVISNPSNQSINYELWRESTGVTDVSTFSTEGTITVPLYGGDKDIQDWYWITVCASDGTQVAFEQSEFYSDYIIEYKLANNDGTSTTVSKKTGGVEAGASFTHVVDKYIVENGIEYELVGSTGQSIYFGKTKYMFEYQEYIPGDKTAHVFYRDQDNNILKTDIVTIPYSSDPDAKVEYNLPATWTDSLSGRTYTKISNADKLTWNYDSEDLTFDAIYQIDEESQTGTYAVRVNFVDAMDNSVTLGSEYLTVYDDGTPGITYDCPTTISTTSNGVTYYYEVEASQQTIHHAYDNATRIYTVEYNLFDEQSPYDWVIEYRDFATNTTIGSDTVAVNPPVGSEDSVVTFRPPAQVSNGGTDYILEAGMNKEYSHTYGRGSRILYVYYNEAGVAAPTSIDVSIRCVSVSDDAELDNVTLTVTPNAAGVFSVQPTIQAGGKEYVLLDGQKNADGSLNMTYNYYTQRRADVFYYRDINDLENANTYVTREEVVTSVVYQTVPGTTTTTVTGTGTGTGTGTAAATTGGTVLTDGTTGETTTITDEGVPLSDARLEEEAPGQKTLKDEDVPKASGQKGIIGAIGSHPWIIILAAVAILAFILLLAMKKKKNEA